MQLKNSVTNQPPHKYLTPSFSMGFQRSLCRGLCPGGQEAHSLMQTMKVNSSKCHRQFNHYKLTVASEDTWPCYPMTVRKKGLMSTLPILKPVFGRHPLAFAWLGSKYPFRSAYLLTQGYIFLLIHYERFIRKLHCLK